MYVTFHKVICKNLRPHLPFSFLLAVTEVIVNLAEAFFVCHKAPRPLIDFMKRIAKDLINKEYLMQEMNKQEIRRIKRKALVYCVESWTDIILGGG